MGNTKILADAFSLPERASRKITSATSPNALALFGIPVALSILVLFCSPNYDSGLAGRQHPLGSDFLQEWVGGRIWLSNQSSALYSESHFRAVQHDTSVVGFDWPEDQYFPMVYPPFHYMLVSPLAMLPYRVAIVIWLLFLGVMAGATAFCFTRFHATAKQHWGKCLVAMIAFCPLLISLNMAQKSILLLFILTATWMLLHHRHPFKAGMVFGLIAFKPHLGILIGVAMLLKGQWRFVGGCLVTVGLLVGLSFVAGPDLCADYFQQCISMGDYSQNGGYRFAQSHNISGALAVTFGNDSVVAQAVIMVLAILVVVVLVISLRGPLDCGSHRFAHQFSQLVIATMLLSPHFYVYDLAIMLLPIGLMLCSASHGRDRNRSQRTMLSPIGSMPCSDSEDSRFSAGNDTMAQISRMLILCCVALFVISGNSERMAEHLSFQPTLPLLLAFLCLPVCRPSGVGAFPLRIFLRLPRPRRSK